MSPQSMLRWGSFLLGIDAVLSEDITLHQQDLSDHSNGVAYNMCPAADDTGGMQSQA